MKKLVRYFLSVMMLLSEVTATAQPQANMNKDNGKDISVGIVLDLQGQASVLENAQRRKIQLLSYLKQNAQVQLEEGSKLSVSLYANRTVYRFVGPATIVVDKDQMRSIKGAPPEIKQVKEKLVAGAESGQLLAGAIRMRQLPPKIAVLTPENGVLLLRAPKELTWASMEKTSVAIRIVDEDENLIIEGQSSQNSWPIPAHLLWTAGKAYKWNVSFISRRDGGRYLSSGEFRLADAQVLSDLENLKPSDTALIEEWVLYAAYLQSQSLFQEARDVWKKIGKKRPD
ncbi:MAG: hypothetical protein K2P84_06980 [Undibacterium sp.]|nr:hypothetical protein [Undibacterium sp.]